MRLHLGCGDVHLSGWVNVDRRYLPGVDRVANIGILQHYPESLVEEIYSCHALDHFDRWTYMRVLERWRDLLKPGGVLRISTPDFRWTALRYLKLNDLGSLTGQLYAGQDYPDNVRHFMWDYEMAVKDLSRAGFVDIERYNPYVFLQDQPQDASCLMDECGNYRSLNLTARKP